MVTFDQAQSIVAGAHGRATALGIRVAVAVVDEGGFLLALGRMDGAPPLSPRIAEAKAAGAALWHKDGGAMAAVQAASPSFVAAVAQLARTPLLPGLGSVLIRHGDNILGAVGVSGASGEHDAECAEVGIRSVLG